MSDQLHNYICFRLNEERYIHNVQSVREIMRYEQPTPVPGAPMEVEGILNVRGEVVCILSGQRLLGIEHNSGVNEDWRIIIIDSSDGWMGISVDAVDEMVKLREHDIEWLDQQQNSPYITGTVQNKQELLIVTDLVQPELSVVLHH